MRRYRDIQLIEQNQDRLIAIACDVSGGIGPKEHDVIKVSNYVAGYYATVVPLIELLCIGAKPISMVNTLSVEMKPSGIEIIEGIHKAMEEVGIDRRMLTGSTEDNIQTSSTGIGMTVIGEVKKAQIEEQMPKIGQSVYLIGIPKSGEVLLREEIKGKKGEIITMAIVKQMRLDQQVGHMLPVGSKGIRYEAETLAKLSHLNISIEPNLLIDMEASAGPATCMLISLDERNRKSLNITLPIIKIGTLTEGSKSYPEGVPQ